jgi:hypothetical protein
MDKAIKIYEALKGSFYAKTPDLKTSGDHLATLKVLVAHIVIQPMFGFVTAFISPL